MIIYSFWKKQYPTGFFLFFLRVNTMLDLLFKENQNIHLPSCIELIFVWIQMFQCLYRRCQLLIFVFLTFINKLLFKRYKLRNNVVFLLVLAVFSVDKFSTIIVLLLEFAFPTTAYFPSKNIFTEIIYFLVLIKDYASEGQGKRILVQHSPSWLVAWISNLCTFLFSVKWHS